MSPKCSSTITSLLQSVHGILMLKHQGAVMSSCIHGTKIIQWWNVHRAKRIWCQNVYSKMFHPEINVWCQNKLKPETFGTYTLNIHAQIEYCFCSLWMPHGGEASWTQQRVLWIQKWKLSRGEKRITNEFSRISQGTKATMGLKYLWFCIQILNQLTLYVLRLGAQSS